MKRRVPPTPLSLRMGSSQLLLRPEPSPSIRSPRSPRTPNGGSRVSQTYQLEQSVRDDDPCSPALETGQFPLRKSCGMRSAASGCSETCVDVSVLQVSLRVIAGAEH